MFDWLGDFIGGIGDDIGSTFDFLGEQISNAIWNTMLQWFYKPFTMPWLTSSQ